MPLEHNDHEMTLLLTLSEPIDQSRRPDFLRAVAAELEAQRSSGAIGRRRSWRETAKHQRSQVL
jgi:hypothetical protein